MDIAGVIGAAAALSGVALSQVISLLHSHLDRRHQRRVLLRSKYEELMGHLNESLEWANSMTLAGPDGLTQSARQPMPARRVYALVLLYFPLLKQESVVFLQACLDFQSAIHQRFLPSVNASASAQAAKENGEVLSAASSGLKSARLSLDAAIEKCAKKYITA